jgi:hypothetical protein
MAPTSKKTRTGDGPQDRARAADILEKKKEIMNAYKHARGVVELGAELPRHIEGEVVQIEGRCSGVHPPYSAH